MVYRDGFCRRNCGSGGVVRPVDAASPAAKNKEETVASAAPVSVAKAVRSNDLRAIRDNVMAWGRKQYPQSQVRNLDDIAKLSGDPQFAVQLQQLRKALYSGNPEGFDAGKFMNVFADVSRNRKNNRPKKRSRCRNCTVKSVFG